MSIKSMFYKSGGKNYLKWYPLTHNQSDLDGALERFSKAVIADPKDLEAYAFKSSALMNMGRFEEALKTMDQALQANPGSTEYVTAIRQPLLEFILEKNSNKILENQKLINIPDTIFSLLITKKTNSNFHVMMQDRARGSDRLIIEDIELNPLSLLLSKVLKSKEDLVMDEKEAEVVSRLLKKVEEEIISLNSNLSN